MKNSENTPQTEPQRETPSEELLNKQLRTVQEALEAVREALLSQPITDANKRAEREDLMERIQATDELVGLLALRQEYNLFVLKTVAELRVVLRTIISSEQIQQLLVQPHEDAEQKLPHASIPSDEEFDLREDYVRHYAQIGLIPKQAIALRLHGMTMRRVLEMSDRELMQDRRNIGAKTLKQLRAFRAAHGVE